MSPIAALSRLELSEFLLPAGDFAPSIVALQPLVPPARRGTRSAPHGTSAQHLERDARDLEEVLLVASSAAPCGAMVDLVWVAAANASSGDR